MNAETETQCPCENLTVVKRGFNTSKAMTGLIGMVSICILMLFMINRIQKYSLEIDQSVYETARLSAPDYHRYDVLNYFLYAGAFVVSLLGLLVGTVGMNETYSVCPMCGKKESLKN